MRGFGARVWTAIGELRSRLLVALGVTTPMKLSAYIVMVDAGFRATFDDK